MEHKTEFPNHLSGGFASANDLDLVYILKDIISDAIIDNHVYLDTDDIERAVEVMYPLVFNIVFNTQFHIRHDEKEIEDLITYLVTHLS